MYNMAAINPATIENADPDKCANAPFTPQPGEKRKALKSRDFKASRLVEQDELNPNQMPLLPLPWELFPFRRGSCT